MTQRPGTTLTYLLVAPVVAVRDVAHVVAPLLLLDLADRGGRGRQVLPLPGLENARLAAARRREGSGRRIPGPDTKV